MRLVLIRHGETYANTLYGTQKQQLIGALDNELTKLNETGIKQAEEAKTLVEKYLPIDTIYVSDLTRTKQTASIIFPNREYILEPRLRERSLGSLEGVLLAEILQDERVMDLVDLDRDGVERAMLVKPSDGECYQDVFDRLREFLSTLDFESDSTVALVSHFHTLRCLLYILLDLEVDESLFALNIRNSYPYVLEYKNGRFQCISDDPRV
ncbi:MAG: histidine phosphatase family protein [Erysipelotrichaceae bacterium]|nr:histidine phosphatase family protein [Erysipelotrichaceae bacterium]